MATVLASTVLELPREGLTNRYSGYYSQISNSTSMDYSPKEENLKRVDGRTTFSSLIVFIVTTFVLFLSHMCDSIVQWFLTRGDFVLQGTFGNSWRHF